MVAEAFILNPENKPFVNHKDGNKTNNAVDNLEWVTASENTQHAWDIGLISKTSFQGENAHSSILKDEQVLYIRSVYIPYSKEFGCRALARKFGVDKTAIVRIVNNITWTHLLD